MSTLRSVTLEDIPTGDSIDIVDLVPIPGQIVDINVAINTINSTLGDEVDFTKGAAVVGRSAQTVPTYADIRGLLKTTKAKTVFVEGNSSHRDGGEGTFILDEADTTTPEDYGTVLVAADGGRWKRLFSGAYNLRWFGAKGDGVTDDTVAVQRAADAARGKVLEVPPGDHRLTATVRLYANTHLKGVHRIPCRFSRNTDYGHTFVVGDDALGAQGFKCTDIEMFHGAIYTGTEGALTGVRATSGAHIYIRGANMCHIERCHFYRMQYNLQFGGGAWVHLKDNLFYGVFDDLIPANCEGFSNLMMERDVIYGHPVEWFVESNNFSGAKKPYVGFPIVSTDGTYFTTAMDNFTYVMGAAQAVEIRALESAVFTNNYFGGANRYGFAFVGQDLGGFPFNPFNIRIANNMFDPSLIAQVGFVSQIANCYAWDIVLTGNHFIGDRNGKSAVWAQQNATSSTHSVLGLVMTGNMINGHYGTGAILEGALGFTVTGNIITDYNKLGASTTDDGYISAVAVRAISAKGLLASNTIGGGPNYAGSGNCINGISVQLSTSGIVQSGNHRIGTVNWTAQTYPV